MVSAIEQVSAPSDRMELQLKEVEVGPRGSWLTGVLNEFAADPLAFVTHSARRYGDVVKLPFGPIEQTLVSDPELIEEILVKRHSSFIKDEVTRHLSTALGDGLLVSEGKKWRAARKRVAPKLRKKQIAAYADAMVSHTEALVGGFVEGELRDIRDDMMLLTLDIVAETLFGGEVGQDAHKVGEVMESLMEMFVSHERSVLRFVPDWIPTPGRVKARKGLEELDELLFRIIDARRAGEPGDDLLWLLIEATDDDGQTMDDVQLRDESLTLFLAGHETTALALSYAIMQVAEHACVERRLVAELDEVLEGRRPEVGDFRRLPFTEAVVKEAMRLYPPAWAVGREAIEDVEVGGLVIPKGQQVMMSQWVVHRDPRWWPEPESFKPERWLEDAPQRPRFAYFPFGGGPRVCVGNHFAMMEMVLVLATIYQRASLRRESFSGVGLTPAVTLRPDGPIEMRVSLRGDA